MKVGEWLKSERGQSLVETALVLPIILLILMGIIDFGLLFNNYMVISNASREGARSAAIGSTDSEIRASVTDMTSTLNQSRLRITITPSEASRRKGEQVSVQLEYDNNLVTPIVAAVIQNPVQLRARTVMRVE